MVWSHETVMVGAGTREQVREVLDAKGWSVKGIKVIGFPGQGTDIFLPGASCAPSLLPTIPPPSLSHCSTQLYPPV